MLIKLHTAAAGTPSAVLMAIGSQPATAGPALTLNCCTCWLQFRKLGYETVDMICEYMKSVPDAKVVPDVQVRLALTPQSCHTPYACM